MGCIVAILAMLIPRVVMFFIWLLTDYFARAFETIIWPLLGFFFMPYTTLAYMAAMLNNNHNISGWWFALVIGAVLLDLSHWGGSGRARYRRRRDIVV